MTKGNGFKKGAIKGFKTDFVSKKILVKAHNRRIRHAKVTVWKGCYLWEKMLLKEFLNVLVAIQKWQHTRSQVEEQATDILNICFVMYARKSKALCRLTIIS